ncbi:MAG TPA: hydrogenase maturation protease [Acidimicrobiales bacterium]|nr:hydrogenase maturation protease [Acidimicrobiales bacterium]
MNAQDITTGAATTHGERPRAVVVGLGNPYRGDDGVGPAVAELVERRLGRTPLDGLGLRVEVLAGIPDPMDLIGRWDDALVAVVVDAAETGTDAAIAVSPGTVSVIAARRDRTLADLPAAWPTSTHHLGLGTAIRVAHALDSAPAQVLVVAVEGEQFGFSDALSPPVAAAVELAADRVLQALADAADEWTRTG